MTYFENKIAEVLVFVLCVAGCDRRDDTHPVAPPQDRTTRDTVDIADLVLRTQFLDLQNIAPKHENVAYIVAIANEPDELFRRLASHNPPVLRLSAVVIFPDGTVTYRGSKVSDVVFHIGIRWIDADTVEVQSGYRVIRGASIGGTWRLLRKEDSWIIAEKTAHSIS